MTQRRVKGLLNELVSHVSGRAHLHQVTLANNAKNTQCCLTDIAESVC